ncbi:unnamed protein product [Fusarium graminearum]|uniref:Chromosome 2, complete genome n=2 Tax=Gibberella zeae TaxID=5518 RepID=A0A098DDP7_GIBZE|nr:unnamed protein product [Fusarium graminearum]CAG1977104.1 unnamed protein product [Fusarium graminearum]CAG2013200.1 unnamed protein product [Fusarium graminearum]CEF76572.1 unnamed protein product [Fusarium graminearum]
MTTMRTIWSVYIAMVVMNARVQIKICDRPLCRPYMEISKFRNDYKPTSFGVFPVVPQRSIDTPLFFEASSLIDSESHFIFSLSFTCHACSLQFPP